MKLMIGYVVLGTMSEPENKPFRVQGYIGETVDEVLQQVLGKARREGFKGTIAERMEELGWWVEPAFTADGAGAVMQDALRHRATRVVMIKEHEDCIPDVPEVRTAEAFDAWSDELIVNLQRYHPEDMP